VLEGELTFRIADRIILHQLVASSSCPVEPCTALPIPVRDPLATCSCSGLVEWGATLRSGRPSRTLTGAMAWSLSRPNRTS
jgi:hypothetical protein